MTLCQRDSSHGPASHRVTSDIIDMQVCDSCSVAAYEQINWQRGQVGAIRIEPIGQAQERAPE